MGYRHILEDFYLDLEVPDNLPEGVEVLNPYLRKETQQIVSSFFTKFYSNEEKRILLIGINPGRFGAGVTGVGFTDPIHLEEYCGIPNSLEKKHELSSIFMYKMINALGGGSVFFNKFLFSSVSPLGFVKNGKNLNYYDIPALRERLEGFMVNTLKRQVELGGSSEIAFCIGRGENFAYLKKINSKHNLFKELDVLPHPRWVLQYRRKKTDEYVREYVEKLSRYI